MNCIDKSLFWPSYQKLFNVNYNEINFFLLELQLENGFNDLTRSSTVTL